MHRVATDGARAWGGRRGRCHTTRSITASQEHTMAIPTSKGGHYTDGACARCVLTVSPPSTAAERGVEVGGGRVRRRRRLHGKDGPLGREHVAATADHLIRHREAQQSTQPGTSTAELWLERDKLMTVMYLCLSLCVCLCLSLCLSLSVCICLCICICICLCLCGWG